MGSYTTKKSPSQKLNSVYILRRVREFLKPPILPLCRRMSADPILLSNHAHSDCKMATMSCLMTEFPTPALGWVLFVCLFSVPRIIIKVIVKVVPFVQLEFYFLARKESNVFMRVPFNIKNLSKWHSI